VRKHTRVHSSSSKCAHTIACVQVRLEWSQVTCTLSDKKHGTEKNLLEGVSGVAKPGR